MLLTDFSISRLLSAWLVLGSIAIAAPAEEVRWRGDFAAARAEAVRLGRPTIVVVKSASCGWCRELERTTLRDVRVIGFLNGRTIPVQLDADDPDQATVLEALRVEGLPTIAVVAADGRVVSNHGGYLEAEPFLRMLGSVIDGSKRRR